jgi:hypothetical protein
LGIFRIFPTDLRYFIQFEEEDYEDRIQAGRDGVHQPRQCPTADMYNKGHQAGLVPAGSRGGLYKWVILRQFLAALPNFNPIRVWHGAPLAAIRRALISLGSINARAIEKDDIDNIRRLQELYSRDDPPVIQLSNRASRAARRGKKRERGDSWIRTVKAATDHTWLWSTGQIFHERVYSKGQRQSSWRVKFGNFSWTRRMDFRT